MLINIIGAKCIGIDAVPVEVEVKISVYNDVYIHQPTHNQKHNPIPFN